MRDLADLYRQCFIYPGAEDAAIDLLRARAVEIAGADVFVTCVVGVTYNNLAWWADNKTDRAFDQACDRAEVLFAACRKLCG